MSALAPSAYLRALHGLIFFTLLTISTQVPHLRMWPLLWIVPLTAYFAIVATTPALRATCPRWRFGRISASTAIAAVAIALCTIVTLIVFHSLSQPDVSGYRTMLPVERFGGIAGTAILFPLLNAALEEIVFRGLLFDSVAALSGNMIAVAVSAAFFGSGHMQGYPAGVTGAVLAGIFGLATGWLRVATGGLGLCWLVHIAADATIFTLLAHSQVW